MKGIPLLEARLEPSGLRLRGVLNVARQEVDASEQEVDGTVQIALVGNMGSSYWPAFVRSPEYRDEKPHPLDRWSRRIGEALADEMNARAIYPFDGPPYYPFQQWARRAESLRPSKLGMMIHPEYGLWHSYRFALVFTSAQALPDRTTVQPHHPCESCKDQPCLNTCPVNAFTEHGYDVDGCAAYLESSPQARCHSQGCMARLSCPEGDRYRYDTAQHRFHLRAFLASR